MALLPKQTIILKKFFYSLAIFFQGIKFESMKSQCFSAFSWCLFGKILTTETRLPADRQGDHRGYQIVLVMVEPKSFCGRDI